MLASCVPQQIHYNPAIQELGCRVISIELPDWYCNDLDYEEFDFSGFARLQSLEIGENSFGSVKRFRLEGMPELRSLKIGSESFTGIKRYCWMDEINFSTVNSFDESKSFHILNCDLLESIELGAFCFCDFSGEFELKNLRSLRSITFGIIDDVSFNFCGSRCVIQGIVRACVFILDLPSLQKLVFGQFSFYGCPLLTLAKLDSLESILIGENCFCSVKTFLLNGLDALKWIHINKDSFTKVTSFLWNDPKQKTAHLNDPKKTFHILNCKSLESIMIDEFCFSDFQGEFELLNLPSLNYLKIGSLTDESVNFRYSQCVIRSIAIVVFVIRRSSKSKRSRHGKWGISRLLPNCF